MQKKNLFIILPVLSVLCATIVLVWWLHHDPVKGFIVAVPGMDSGSGDLQREKQEVRIGEAFTYFGTTDHLAGSGWPRFRGTDADNISKENIPLIEKWDDLKGRIKWTLELGEGHAAPSVYDGRVYLLDYDESKKSDALRCFSLKDGKELWRREYKVHLKRNHGLSRTIPAVNEKYAVTIGPKCHVMCVDRITGELKFGIDLVKDMGTEVPFWYTGQCPLLVGDTLVIAPGGKALLAAIDCKTGKVLWETPNLKRWKMSHSSVIPATIEGKMMFVYFAIGGVCGVSASGADCGKILWESSAFAPAVVAPSPVVLSGGLILLTAGYGAGTAMFRIRKVGDQWKAEMIQQFRPNEGIASEQQTPVYYQGLVYSIQPKDAGGDRNQFVAVKPGDGKKFVMTSGKKERFGLGPYLMADNKFFILNDDGEMTIARVSSSQFAILDKGKILNGQDAWGPLAITNGFLLARDSKHMVCIDIRKR